jgi:hypothetical protein
VVGGAAKHMTMEQVRKAGNTEFACGQPGTLVCDKKG